ncbi:sulfatase [Ancylomarina sp. 16SWW S1-10-2]|uniref:sulfatase family protein n=1 Tax=Ancylomarina sp. 16SWW S1-10-2 TaxID=2499681 RepID=UPI0012ADBB21|nr:sulfatase-like hydrolase/transferase [Ancylomarina sp. 16SWW S1-10-2]MRT91957.1 DUF4976 domain-containing protein [Ancylomarina sp. 16SWW S1-10-2]
MNNKIKQLTLLALIVFAGAIVSPVFAKVSKKETSKKESKKPFPEKRNVIFIIMDDMRLDMAGFGGGKMKTPNLDKLASESTCFSEACTTTGLCSPSRAALFTGRYGHRTGLDDNLHLWHSPIATLPADQPTIIEWAKNAGYNVGYIGKWHVGYVTPEDRGADMFIGRNGASLMKKFKRPKFESLDKYYEKGKTFEEKPEYYSTDKKKTFETSEPEVEVNGGIKFLRKAANDSRPFYLTVGFHTPHPAYTVPAPYDKMYDYNKVVLPESYKENKPGLEYQHDVLWPWMNLGHMSDDDWRKTTSYSMGLMTMCDQSMGKLFDEIKRLGMWDNTLIVFTSDQGSMLSEHGLYDKGPYAYDGLMRIPMLIKAPNTAPQKIKHQVSLIDLNQTLVEYMHLQPTVSNVDSRSLIPLLKNGNEAWANVPDVAFYRYEWYNGHWFGERAVRTPDWKYCFNPCGDDELYDLKNDSQERVNLYRNKAYADQLKTMRDVLLKHLGDVKDLKVKALMERYIKCEKN